MKLILTSILFLSMQSLLAQSFSEVIPTPFPGAGVYSSSIAFADVDGDNDQDVLITGEANGANPTIVVSKLYINDGKGNYIEKANTPFEYVRHSSIAFADVDGDNDQDVLITGEAFDGNISRLYINDGKGNYNSYRDQFEKIFHGSVAFADVDGDDDQDVLIAGIVDVFTYITKLYINDGKGNYTEKSGTPFPGSPYGSLAFADVDGDNDQDVLITGNPREPGLIAKLYINDGMGNYTEKSGTPFPGVWDSSVAFADVDGDDDQDVLITGNVGGDPYAYVAKLYINDGLGNYTEKSGTPFPGVGYGSIAFADVDGDNDQDVLLTGYTGYDLPSFTRITKLYTNDGMGNYLEKLGTPFPGVRYGSIAFADVDGDSDQDVLITGSSGQFEFGPISKLYINDGVATATDEAEKEGKNIFKLYPNPATGGRVMMDYYSDKNKDVQISIIDMYGRTIRTQVEGVIPQLNHIPFDVQELAKGVYFIKIDTDNQANVSRLVVK